MKPVLSRRLIDPGSFSLEMAVVSSYEEWRRQKNVKGRLNLVAS